MDTVSSSQSTLESVLDDSTSEATTSDVNLNSDLLFSDRSKSVHYSEGERFTKEAIYCQSYPISFQYINSEKEIRVYSATDPEFLLYYKAVSPHHQLNETCLHCIKNHGEKSKKFHYQDSIELAHKQLTSKSASEKKKNEATFTGIDSLSENGINENVIIKLLSWKGAAKSASNEKKKAETGKFPNSKGLYYYEQEKETVFSQLASPSGCSAGCSAKLIKIKPSMPETDDVSAGKSLEESCQGQPQDGVDRLPKRKNKSGLIGWMYRRLRTVFLGARLEVDESSPPSSATWLRKFSWNFAALPQTPREPTFD